LQRRLKAPSLSAAMVPNGSHPASPSPFKGAGWGKEEVWTGGSYVTTPMWCVCFFPVVVEVSHGEPLNSTACTCS
jgi:hypothetical protein